MKKATFFARMKKLAMLALTAVMLVSALSVGAWAAEYGEKKYQHGDALYGNYEEDAKFAKCTYLNPRDILNCYNNGTKVKFVQYRDENGKDILTDDMNEYNMSGVSYEIKKISDINTKYSNVAGGKWLIVSREQDIGLDGVTKLALILQFVPDADDFVPVSVSLPTVQLSRRSATGYVGGTLDLDFKSFNMRTPEVTWASSDEAVATVDADGIVTFVKKGKATITLDVVGYGQLTCAVTVKNKGIIKR
ncbi:MAG: Ig-like domain-containing protein [Eubacteriales bacterium]